MQLVIDLGETFADHGTLSEVILDRAAAQIVRQLSKDDITRRIQQVRDDEIREVVKPMIADTIGLEVQLTDTYGAPQGPPMPLREVIVKKATEQFVVRKDGFSSSRKTPLEEYISSEIERVFRRELNEAMAEARAQVLAAVREEGAQLITQTIARMAKAS
jgi:hypothetical protein